MLLHAIVIYFCISSTSSSPSQNYEDWLARDRFFPLAAAVLGNQAEGCLESFFTNATILNIYKTDCGITNGECDALLAVSDYDNAVLLSFRGPPIVFSVIGNESSSWKSRGKVLQPYINAFDSMWNSSLTTALKKLTFGKNYNLWITGYSSGGALASMFAAELSSAKIFSKDKITLITFGEPPIGDQKYAKFLDGKLAHSWRVVNGKDAIVYGVGKTRFHHKAAVEYEVGMKVGDTYTVCNQNWASPNGTLRISDHSRYFEANVMKFGRSGCQDY